MMITGVSVYPNPKNFDKIVVCTCMQTMNLFTQMELARNTFLPPFQNFINKSGA